MDYPIASELDRPFTPGSVLDGYRHGIFPMGDESTNLVFWFRPDPRAIFPLDSFRVSRSLARTMRRVPFRISYDQAFAEVVVGCAEGRPVWITERVFRLYQELHRRGHAHSVEVWLDDELVGGTYGVQIGGAFMAESKFHRVTDASKVALAKLVERLRERGFGLLEVQYLTPHLASLGAVEIPLSKYLRRVRALEGNPCVFGGDGPDL